MIRSTPVRLLTQPWNSPGECASPAGTGQERKCCARCLYRSLGQSRNCAHASGGSASARRSIQRRVALRRLFPALPPISDVLLGRGGVGAPRSGQCLCFVDFREFAHVGPEIFGPRERLELMYPSLPSEQRAAIGRRRDRPPVGDRFPSGRSDRERSFVGCSRSLAHDRRLRSRIREGGPPNVAPGYLQRSRSRRSAYPRRQDCCPRTPRR